MKSILYERKLENLQLPYLNSFQITFRSMSKENSRGQRIKLKGEVSMITDGENPNSEGMVCYLDTEYEYGIYLGEPVYVVIEDISTRILEYDVITCYGELSGVDDLGVGEYPVLNVVYYEIK